MFLLTTQGEKPGNTSEGNEVKGEEGGLEASTTTIDVSSDLSRAVAKQKTSSTTRNLKKLKRSSLT
jgi:hypothetical protein